MVSRENRVRAGAIGLAFAMFLLWFVLLGLVEGIPESASIVVMLAVLFVGAAGSHLYLVLVGESEDVDAATRVRFVALVLAVLLVAGVTASVPGGDPAAGVTLWNVLRGLLLGLVLVYFVWEVRVGYRNARSEG